jgi:sulfonate transport system substrate-binding protein
MFVTDVFAKAYPETTERIVRGMVKAAYWLAQPQNRAEAVAIWAKIGVPAKSIAEDVADRPLRDQLNPLLNGFVRAQYKDGEAFAREERLIRKDFDVDAWINNAFLDQALRETSLTDFWPVRTDEDAKQP